MVEWDTTVRKGWILVRARGEDSEAFSNLLRKKHGEIPIELSKLQKWDVLQGFATSAGRVGYGVYVDIGILEPAPKDALYPLHRMRAQLSDGEQKSAREILAENAIIDNFPVSVIVTGIEGEKVGVELSDESRELFQSWKNHPWDRLIMVGHTEGQAQDIVRRTRLAEDIVEIQSLSLFVQSLVLKVGTEAPGIIARIGRQLRGVSLAAYTQHKKIG